MSAPEHNPNNNFINGSDAAFDFVIAILVTGLQGKVSNASIHARKGLLSIKLFGRTVAKGSTPEELRANFNAAREAAARHKASLE